MAARQYDFHPFWSYKVIETGRAELLTENIMNVVVFVPVGFLLAIGIPRLKMWKALLTGVFLSALIEILQFANKRGFSELDDVMHNTFGCVVGYALYKSAQLLFERFLYKNPKGI